MLKSELTDEQIIALSRDGDSSHIEEIYDRYKNMVRTKVSAMYMLGGDVQDLNQEGMIGLFKAVRDYDFGRDASFATFAHLCVERQIYNALKSSGRLKNMPLNEYVSLSAEKISEDGDTKLLIDELVGDPKLEPEGSFISKENVDRINNLIDTILTRTERDVFQLYITGLPTSRIGAILGMESKSADNALQRAKAKLRKALSDTK